MSTTFPIDPTKHKRFDRESINETQESESRQAKVAPGVAAFLWIIVAMAVGVMVFEMTAFG